VTQQNAISPKRSIRWPFRVLAALVVLAGAVAVLAATWMIWRDPWSEQGEELVIFLPGIAWILNLSLSAAISGRSPEDLHWPFATERVFGIYVIVAFFVAWW